jgi:metallophosphoesterase superfamily enzyme
MGKGNNSETVLVIPDTQIPFEHEDSLGFLEMVVNAFKPTSIVQIGDLVDHHALSKYVSDPDGMSAGDELKATVKTLKKFYKMFPNVDVIVGNHDERLKIKAYEAGIPKAYIRGLDDVLEFPEGWVLHDELTIDGVLYEHGHSLGSGGGNNAFKKAIDANMMNTVYGHFHSSAGIRYFANKKHLCFAFNVGCLMDRHSYAAQYGKNFPQKPILGCGIVHLGIPMFIPMILDGNSRWIGALHE